MENLLIQSVFCSETGESHLLNGLHEEVYSVPVSYKPMRLPATFSSRPAESRITLQLRVNIRRNPGLYQFRNLRRPHPAVFLEKNGCQKMHICPDLAE